MASTSQPINVAILGSATPLYTAFVEGGATRAMLVSLDLTNTTASDITVDLYYLRDSDASKKYFADDLTVPAKGNASFRGMLVIDTVDDSWVAIASAVGIDAVGAVIENA